MYLGEPVDLTARIPFDGRIGAYIKVLRRELDDLHKEVHDQKVEIKQRETQIYNKKHKAVPPSWEAGQKVLLQDKTIKKDSNKILTKPPCRGPFYITEVVKGKGNYLWAGL